MQIIQDILADIQALTVLEILAVICALAYVILAWFEKVSCWIFGIISSAIFMYITYKVNYKLEAFLYLFYVLMGFYGWWEWSKGLKRVDQKAVVTSLTGKETVYIVFGGLAMSGILGFIFDNYLSSSLAYLDAITTVFAIITTWMTARKILENWIFWFVIDLISIYLYVNKGLYFTTLLYFLYVVISVAGYINWLKSYRKSKILSK